MSSDCSVVVATIAGTNIAGVVDVAVGVGVLFVAVFFADT